MKLFQSYSRVLPWFMALLLSAFVAACGGGKDPILGSPDVAPTAAAPTVNSVEPANAATGVLVNRNLTAIFSEAMDSATITAAGTFILKQGLVTIPGSVTYAGTTATFNPDSNLAADTLYTATITTWAKNPAGLGLAADKVWSFSTGVAADASAPAVSSVDPSNAATGVAPNRNIAATFSEAMDVSTVTTTTMTLKQGLTPVAGIVTYVGRTAIFNPDSNLAANTVYTATVSTGTKDLAGNALASDFVWSFTTGAAADSTPPTVTSTIPADAAIGVAVNANISATFNEAIDPLTVTGSSMTLKQGGILVAGAVTTPSTTSAIFNPDNNLAANTTYTATITTSVKDLAGNALALAKTWSFTTLAAAALGPLPVNLGTAGNFVILSKAGVSTTGTTAIVGDIGVSPIDATAITGFAMTADSSNQFSTSSLVTGKIYAANYATSTPAMLTTAISDLETAFTDAAGRPTPDFTELGAGNISGLTLVPGLYKWGTGVLITSTGVTLAGGANDVWIFQVGQNLTVDNSALVTLSGGAQAKNIFWQVAGQVTLGTAADFKGNILSKTLISLNTGAVLNGRALAQTAVTLNASSATKPAP